MIYTAESHYAKAEYALAIPFYEKLANQKRTTAAIFRRLASCYAHIDAYGPAAYWYGRLVADTGAVAEDWLQYGDMLKSEGHYAEAKAAYGHCGATVRAAGCDSAIAWLQQPADLRIDNMLKINTGASDWGAVWYGDRQIVFTSDSLRPTVLDPAAKINRKNFGWTDRPYQKVYVVDSTDGYKGLGLIRGFAAALNRPEYHVGPVAFSPGYDTAYFTVTNPAKIGYSKETLSDKRKGTVVWYRTRRLELYYSIKDSNRQWQQPVAFAYNNPDSFSIGHAALSPDRTVLYFASDMPGGQGKTDIWYSVKQPDGRWGTPLNCGPAINTPEEEEFPTMGGDGTLYFSSKGHPGMGGFDLFRATGSRGQWTAPANMRPPLNSPGDDFYYEPRDSVSGFFSSNRPGGRGSDDIYRYYARTNSPTPTQTEREILVLETTVLDRQGGKPLGDAWVCLMDSNREARWTQQTAADGMVYNIVTPDHRYSDRAARDGYGSDEKGLNTTGLYRADTLRVTLYLGRAEPELPDSMKLSNIYYDFDRWNIRPEAARTLDQLITLMNQHPSMELELSSYTDSRGSIGYNVALSEKRAASVKNYLINHGIDQGRIKSGGFGKSRMVNGCSTGVPCNESEHQQNRRTEVKMVKP